MSKSLDYTAISKQLLVCLGGRENIRNAASCMTRLRVGIYDMSKVDSEAIKAVDGVMGLVTEEGIQIVFGPGTVNKVFAAFDRELKNSDPSETNSPLAAAGSSDVSAVAKEIKKAQKEKHNKPLQRFFKRIANIFVPLLPGIIAAGLINGITNIINVASDGAMSGLWWYESIRTVGWAVFAYLPIFVGYNAAKEFGGTPILGGIAGAMCIANASMPLLSLFNDKNVILPMTNEVYNPASGGIIAAMFAGALFAFFEKKLRKIIPTVIDTFLTPLIVVVSGALILVIVIQPLSSLLTKGIYEALDFIYNQMGAPGGFIMAGSFLPLVSVGLHQALMPIHAMLNDPNGATAGINYLLPILIMAGGGQVGAGLALFFKTKNKKLKRYIRDSVPVGILGVGEPLMYAVTLPLGRSFATACIGAGLGGMVASLFHIGAVTQGVSGIFGVLIVQPGQEVPFLFSMLCAYVGGFALTWLFGVDEKRINEVYGTDPGETVTPAPSLTEKANMVIASPVDGEIIPISTLNDPVFSTETTGKGVAIMPKDGRFYSPCDGTLEVLFPTGHAYGITTADEVDLFVHIGIDTVNLDGQFFTPHIEPGSTVKKGDLIVEADLDGIKKAGYEIATVVVVCSQGIYKELEKKEGTVSHGAPVIELKTVDQLSSNA